MSNLKKSKLAKKEFSDLPFRTVVYDILSFHPFYLTKVRYEMERPIEKLYGRFKKDKFRKFFPLWKNITVNGSLGSRSVENVDWIEVEDADVV